MTATNHALSGAVIGLVIHQPVIALPLAFASHFALDSIPHFGIRFSESSSHRKLFHGYLLADATLLAGIIGFLILTNAGWLVLACLVLAGSPDFVQAYKYLFKADFRRMPSQNHWFTKFHKNIQRSETPKGIFVETPLAILLFVIILILL